MVFHEPLLTFSLYLFIPILLTNLVTFSDGHVCEGEEVENKIDAFLERPIVGGVKVWHLLMIVIGLGIIATVVFCCIMRCRIPRTKQEIEADTIRKKVTKQFRAHLNKIPIEGMELSKVLNEVKQYEEERVKQGIVEEKRTLLKRLGSFFRVEKQASMEKEEPKETDNKKEIDFENLNPISPGVSKQVSIELEEVLCDGNIIKTPIIGDKMDEMDELAMLKKSLSQGSDDEDNLEDFLAKPVRDNSSDRRKWTLKKIVQDEIQRERMRNIWRVEKQDSEFIDDIQDMAFRADSSLQIDKKDLERLRKASKQREKEEEKRLKKELKRQKSEEEKKLKIEEAERKAEAKRVKEEEKRKAKEKKNKEKEKLKEKDDKK